MSSTHLAASAHPDDPACSTTWRRTAQVTTDPAQVTCKLCRRTVLFARLADGTFTHPAAPPDPVWGAAFDGEARALILGRDRPPGAGLPWCVACGEPIRMTPDVHHRQRRMPGNGRPSNGLAVHNRLEAGQCHHRRIHEDVAGAQANGWILRTALEFSSLATVPLWCSWRGWICVDDGGGWHAASSTAT